MEFVKTMMFLGVKRRVGDKGVSYVVTMFCPGGDSWTFYLRDNAENNKLVSYLLSAQSGQMVDASLLVGTYDGKLFLRLTACEDAA